MTPERYRRAVQRAAPDWAEVERITQAYGRALLWRAIRRAWQSLRALVSGRRAGQ